MPVTSITVAQIASQIAYMKLHYRQWQGLIEAVQNAIWGADYYT